MKRNAAIVLAAFYLLLSTGMYVCTFSCGSNYLINVFTFPPFQTHDHDQSATSNYQEKEKDCKGDNDCPCCKKHGDYTIKENLRPSVDVQFPEIPLTLENIVRSNFQRGYYYVFETTLWPKNHAPPFGNPTSVYIKIHSLLI